MQWGKPSGQLFCVMLSCVVLCMSAVGEAFRSVVLCYVVLQCIMYESHGEAFRSVIYCVDINVLYVILDCKMHSGNLLSWSVDCVIH